MDKIIVSTNKMNPSDEYVCWLDIMGTQSSMSESFEKSANFILRFYASLLKAKVAKVKIYPLMDGVYLTAESLTDMTTALNRIMTCLALVFTNEPNEHRFVVRGAISKGTIQHGSLISDEVCPDITSEGEFRGRLLFGMPMIQAYTSETCAPPFGIFIHESARTVGGLQGRYFYWQRANGFSRNITLQAQLKAELINFFDWEKKRHYYYGLDPEKFEEYKQRVEEYYEMIQEGAARIIE